MVISSAAGYGSTARVLSIGSVELVRAFDRSAYVGQCWTAAGFESGSDRWQVAGIECLLIPGVWDFVEARATRGWGHVLSRGVVDSGSRPQCAGLPGYAMSGWCGVSPAGTVADGVRREVDGMVLERLATVARLLADERRGALGERDAALLTTYRGMLLAQHGIRVADRMPKGRDKYGADVRDKWAGVPVLDEIVARHAAGLVGPEYFARRGARLAIEEDEAVAKAREARAAAPAADVWTYWTDRPVVADERSDDQPFNGSVRAHPGTSRPAWAAVSDEYRARHAGCRHAWQVCLLDGVVPQVAGGSDADEQADDETPTPELAAAVAAARAAGIEVPLDERDAALVFEHLAAQRTAAAGPLPVGDLQAEYDTAFDATVQRDGFRYVGRADGRDCYRDASCDRADEHFGRCMRAYEMADYVDGAQAHARAVDEYRRDRAAVERRVGADEYGTLPTFAWPGGYLIAYYTRDGLTVCADCANGQSGDSAFGSSDPVTGADALEGSYAADHGMSGACKCGHWASDGGSWGDCTEDGCGCTDHEPVPQCDDCGLALDPADRVQPDELAGPGSSSDDDGGTEPPDPDTGDDGTDPWTGEDTFPIVGNVPTARHPQAADAGAVERLRGIVAEVQPTTLPGIAPVFVPVDVQTLAERLTALGYDGPDAAEIAAALIASTADVMARRAAADAQHQPAPVPSTDGGDLDAAVPSTGGLLDAVRHHRRIRGALDVANCYVCGAPASARIGGLGQPDRPVCGGHLRYGTGQPGGGGGINMGSAAPARPGPVLPERAACDCDAERLGAPAHADECASRRLYAFGTDARGQVWTVTVTRQSNRLWVAWLHRSVYNVQTHTALGRRTGYARRDAAVTWAERMAGRMRAAGAAARKAAQAAAATVS